MIVHYKGEIYNVRWTEELDSIIRKAAKEYRDGRLIRWKRADDDGALKGLPEYLSLRDISQRYSYLTHKKKKKQYYCEPSKDVAKKKKRLFDKIIPEELKRKHGWRPRNIWSNKQKRLLKYLASLKKYRKSAVTVDWSKLVEDKRVEQLPFQDAYKLCKYYGSLRAKEAPDYLEKHREDALRYKSSNREKYREGQTRRVKIRRKIVKDFLIAQIKKR